MGPLNTILHKINSWNNAETGFFKRECLSRIANATVTLPVEITAVAQNTFQAAVFTASTALKLVTKAIAYISNSEAIKDFESKLPGFADLLKAISRVVAYLFAGIPLTALFGVILSPVTNFNWHCDLGLAKRNHEDIKTFMEEAICFCSDKKQMEHETPKNDEIQTIDTSKLNPTDQDTNGLILKEQAQKDELKEAFEIFKKEFEEECNSLKIAEDTQALNNAAVVLPVSEEIDIQEKVLGEEPTQPKEITEDKEKQIVARQATFKDEEEIHHIVNETFNHILGEGNYHYDRTTGMILPKNLLEKTHQYIAPKLSGTKEKISNIWTKIPNFREKLPNFRAMIPNFRKQVN